MTCFFTLVTVKWERNKIREYKNERNHHRKMKEITGKRQADKMTQLQTCATFH